MEKIISIFRIDVLSSFWVRAFAGSLLMAISAQVSIPLQPVPFYLTPVVALGIGLMCSSGLAVTIITMYVLEIAMGLPVAANANGGMGVLFGPTGGYIFGYLIMVYAMSSIVLDSKSLMRLVLASVAGTVILYVFGMAQLSLFFGVEKAVIFGLAPYIWEIPLHILLATLFAYKVRNR